MRYSALFFKVRSVWNWSLLCDRGLGSKASLIFWKQSGITFNMFMWIVMKWFVEDHPDYERIKCCGSSGWFGGSSFTRKRDPRAHTHILVRITNNKADEFWGWYFADVISIVAYVSELTSYKSVHRPSTLQHRSLSNGLANALPRSGLRGDC